MCLLLGMADREDWVDFQCYQPPLVSDCASHSDSVSPPQPRYVSGTTRSDGDTA